MSQLLCPKCNIEMKQAPRHPNILFDIYPGTTDATSTSTATPFTISPSASADNNTANEQRRKIIIKTYICPKCGYRKQIKEKE